MPRVSQPVTDADVDLLPDYYPGITAETKADDHGRLGNRIVAIDYGLPDKDMVVKQRAYYNDKSGSPAAVLPKS